MEETRQEIKPQLGFQEDFLASSADIVIGGGAAGAGKTFVLLWESLRHINRPGYGGVIFRRTTPQIYNEGGLWDTSMKLYPMLKGSPRKSTSTWEFPAVTKIKFNHIEYESNILDHQGSQYAFIGFDELTHFTKKMFFYMISRNRSNCGIRPYIRATCNPDPDSWVAEFIEWWIDQETGFPIPERAGVLRYFVMDGDNIVWGNSVDEVIKRCPHIFNDPKLKGVEPIHLVKSVTFIPGTINDNQLFIKENPGYYGNLLALPPEEQLRLLQGNWKVRTDGSALFDFGKIQDLFSNKLVNNPTDGYIISDYARFGSDWTIIFTWKGWEVVRIEVMTKSRTTEAFASIEAERTRTGIGRSSVLVDEDGVGGGVIDNSNGEYNGFHNGATPLPNPLAKGENSKKPENYKDLKNQCYYRIADRVNSNGISINLDNIIIDGERKSEVTIGKKTYDIKKLIIADLQAIKKKNPDADGKKQINSKEEQKNILGGRSPDFGDTFAMREWFEIREVKEPGFYMM
jgi:hypothetical protein